MRSLLFLLFHLHEIAVELIEAALPKSALPRKPVLCHPQLLWHELVGPDASRFVGANKPAALQHFEVFHEGGQRHIEGRSEITDRGRVSAEPTQDVAPCGIG